MQAEYLKNDGVLIGNNLERLSEILSDTKHRAASLRQLHELFVLGLLLYLHSRATLLAWQKTGALGCSVCH